jgi:hypothetical protein
MYLPSTPTFPFPHQPAKLLNRKMNSPTVRRTAALIGIGAVGLLVAGKMMPTKKQTVIWGIGGELDKVNDAVDRAREEAFGCVNLKLAIAIKH